MDFCGKKNSNKLEKLQERALRFVYKDTSSTYEILLKRGNFLPLSIYRLKFLAMEVYKCLNGLNPVYLNDLFKIKAVKYDLRNSSILEQPKFNTVKFGYKSVSYYGSKLWNQLPNDVKNSPSLHIFKNRVTHWCHSDLCRKLEIF